MAARVPFAERGGALRGVLDLATGCYPSFLFGGSPGDALPVFHIHEVTTDWLEPRLQHVDNGYRTITSEEIARSSWTASVQVLEASRSPFDDVGQRVTVAMPLLRRLAARHPLRDTGPRHDAESRGRPSTMESAGTSRSPVRLCDRAIRAACDAPSGVRHPIAHSIARQDILR